MNLLSKTPKVLNKKDGNQENSVYIGRPSKWGNPFSIGKDGNRSDVIEKYKKWVITQDILMVDMVKELKGKNLVCYCSPKKCHGDIILIIANKD